MPLESNDQNKTIYLARHAKSSWDSGVDSDFERPLSDKGFKDAEKISHQIQQLDWKPEVIFCSTAIRASQTCQAYCKQLNYPITNVHWNKNFYSAYVVTLLHSLTSLSGNTQSAMLIGHNPSMEDFLIHLCGETSTSKFRQRNGKLFTTGNVMQITFRGQWKDLIMGDAELKTVLRPKEL